MRGRAIAGLVLALLGAALTPASATACSPILISSLRDLGPRQLFLVGTVGERAPGGRAFTVERSFNGRIATNPMILVFQEGPPVGDCSYYPEPGQQVFLAPNRTPDGALRVSVATLQVATSSQQGSRYLEEVASLYGPGETVAPPNPATRAVLIGLGLAWEALVRLMGAPPPSR